MLLTSGSCGSGSAVARMQVFHDIRQQNGYTQLQQLELSGTCGDASSAQEAKFAQDATASFGETKRVLAVSHALV